MAYKALYRTYRPQKFSEVVGQEVIVKTLQSSIANGKISHAYLFSGPRGTGKTSIARIFAKALNCESAPINDPCGKCDSCREISEGINPDVIEIDAASNNGIDEIRDIRDKVKFLPGGSKYKIYIIDEVHMLSSGAFNALLKTLEEPPRHVVFILATTEPHKVLPTILSRCQRFDFKSLTVKEITERLNIVVKEEDIKIDQEALVGIAESAEGGMRDALSYLDQAISFADDEITIDDVNHVTGNLNYDKIIEVAKYFESKNIEKALKTISEIISLGKEINKVISGLLQFYRDVLLYKNIDTSSYTKYIFEKEEFKLLSETITLDKIFYYVDVLSDVQAKIKFTNTPHIFLEVAIIKMINAGDAELNFLKRINLLEEKVENIGNISNDNIESHPVDSEKVKFLEINLSRVINELSKLELPKLQERVNALENNLLTSNENNDLSSLENKINQFESIINEFKNHCTQEDLNEIDELKETLSKNHQIFEEKYALIKEEILSIVNKELNDIKLSLVKTGNVSYDASAYDFREIREKIANIEEKLYRLISGALSLETPVIKKNKRKVNAGQIVFTGGEITTVSELEKLNKEKVDFGDIQKPDIEIKTSKVEDEISENDDETDQDLSTVIHVLDNEIEDLEQSQSEDNNTLYEEDENSDGDDFDIYNKEKNVFETKTNQTKEETIKDEVLKDNLINEVSKVKVYPDITKASISSELEKARELSFDDKSKLLDIEILKLMGRDITKKPKEEKVKNEVLNVVDLEDKTIIETTNSNIVTKKANKEELSEGIFVLENDKQKNKKSNSFEDILDEQDDKSEDENLDLIESDEFSTFNEKVIERILNESRTDEARNDKSRITNLWKILSKNVNVEDLSIAEILQEGLITAVGNKEFIIVYKSSVLCNQVMSYKFKKKSLKILYDFLGDTYNYMALPEQVWLEKRSEYVNQYNIGVRFPKLTPINDPTLRVISKEEELKYMNQKDKMIATAYEMFGKDIVKIE